jgi:signal transduction histidine kinase
MDPALTLQVLGRAARSLAAAVDTGSGIADAIGEVAGAIVDAEVADWCLVHRLEDGASRPVLIGGAHRDPAQLERARAAPAPPLPSAAGEPRLVPGDALGLGWAQAISAPLAARGRLFGVLTLAVGPGRSLGAAEVELARVVAGMIASAFDTLDLTAERDEMLSVVSHDLRNPLGVVLLVMDLLRQVELPRELASQMARLERASQTMGRIITNVVDVGRLGTPALPLELSTQSLGGLVEQACEASRETAEAKSVGFQLDVDSALQIRGDRNRLAHALDLLIAGAVQRTPARAAVRVSVVRSEERVLLIVADGAPPPAGTELGAVAIRRRTGAFTWMVLRGVARAHGGAVWADGAAVCLALPIAAAQALPVAR